MQKENLFYTTDELAETLGVSGDFLEELHSSLNIGKSGIHWSESDLQAIRKRVEKKSNAGPEQKNDLQAEVELLNDGFNHMIQEFALLRKEMSDQNQALLEQMKAHDEKIEKRLIQSHEILNTILMAADDLTGPDFTNFLKEARVFFDKEGRNVRESISVSEEPDNPAVKETGSAVVEKVQALDQTPKYGLVQLPRELQIYGRSINHASIKQALEEYRSAVQGNKIPDKKFDQLQVVSRSLLEYLRFFTEEHRIAPTISDLNREFSGYPRFMVLSGLGLLSEVSGISFSTDKKLGKGKRATRIWDKRDFNRLSSAKTKNECPAAG